MAYTANNKKKGLAETPLRLGANRVCHSASPFNCPLLQVRLIPLTCGKYAKENKTAAKYLEKAKAAIAKATSESSQ